MIRSCHCCLSSQFSSDDHAVQLKSKCREIKRVLMQVAALLIFFTVCQTTCVSRSAATDLNGLPADGLGHRKLLQVRNVPLSAEQHAAASGFAMCELCEGPFNLTASCPTGSQPLFDCAMPMGKVTLNIDASDCNLVRDIQCCSS